MPVERTTQGLVVWFCGLPGSGKSTIAQEVMKLARQRNPNVILLSMDSLRRKLFPKPTYSDEERDTAYRAFVLIAGFLSKSGINVILDATGHLRKWREFAREECPRFVEAYVRCPVEICMQREARRPASADGIRSNLYADAIKRLKTGEKLQGLGKVPGVDEPFEEPTSPEVILDSSSSSVQEVVYSALSQLSKFYPEIFQTATN